MDNQNNNFNMYVNGNKLMFSVSNIKELKHLINDINFKFDELQKSINKLQNFDLSFEFNGAMSR